MLTQLPIVVVVVRHGSRGEVKQDNWAWAFVRKQTPGNLSAAVESHDPIILQYTASKDKEVETQKAQARGIVYVLCVCAWVKLGSDNARLKMKAENLLHILPPNAWCPQWNEKKNWTVVAGEHLPLSTSCSWADWPANRGPRRGRRRWWRMWPGCTNYGDAGSVNPTCLWSRRHSWRSASPEKGKILERGLLYPISALKF